MTASQIIEEIALMPGSERAKVIRYALELDADRTKSGRELTALAERMLAAASPPEAALLRAEIERGFYGEIPCA